MTQILVAENVTHMLDLFQRVRGESDRLCLPHGLWEYSPDKCWRDVRGFRQPMADGDRYWLVGNSSRGCPDYPEDRVAGIFICRTWDLIGHMDIMWFSTMLSVGAPEDIIQRVVHLPPVLRGLRNP